MFRIDDPSAATSLPVPEAAGTPGYWTEGNPATGVPATLERASWFNAIQEEMMNILAAGGVTPSKTTYNQVLAALQALYGAGRVGHTFTPNDWVPLPGGLILQWCTAPISTGQALTLPIAFPTAMISGMVNIANGAAWFILNNKIAPTIGHNAGGTQSCIAWAIGY
jgi:hypothetical protein